MTAVKVGVLQGPLEVVVVGGEVPVPGQAVLVALLHGPLAEPEEHELGSLACEKSVQVPMSWKGFVNYRGSTPRGWHGILAGVVRRQESGVAPGQVDGRGWVAI